MKREVLVTGVSTITLVGAVDEKEMHSFVEAARLTSQFLQIMYSSGLNGSKRQLMRKLHEH